MNLCQLVGKEMAKKDFAKVNQRLFDAKRIIAYGSGHIQQNVVKHGYVVNPQGHKDEASWNDTYAKDVYAVDPDTLPNTYLKYYLYSKITSSSTLTRITAAPMKSWSTAKRMCSLRQRRLLTPVRPKTARLPA